ncbi:MAG TPA: hypothetical protein VGY48_16040 [Vicinamibacterales bacterium]|jgi:hypothetical protein|nr:hypothetical protein [Vicinamibacterales bacterium]
MLNTLRSLSFLALLSVFMAVPTTSCATLGVAIPIVIAAVQGADLAVNAIESFADGWFAAHPNPTLQNKVSLAIQKAREALAALNALTIGVGDVDQGQLTAAFANFEQAYNDLLSLVGPIGVHAGNVSTMRAEAGSLTVPPASAFKPVKR